MERVERYALNQKVTKIYIQIHDTDSQMWMENVEMCVVIANWPMGIMHGTSNKPKHSSTSQLWQFANFNLYIFFLNFIFFRSIFLVFLPTILQTYF